MSPYTKSAEQPLVRTYQGYKTSVRGLCVILLLSKLRRARNAWLSCALLPVCIHPLRTMRPRRVGWRVPSQGPPPRPAERCASRGAASLAVVRLARQPVQGGSPVFSCVRRPALHGLVRYGSEENARPPCTATIMVAVQGGRAFVCQMGLSGQYTSTCAARRLALSRRALRSPSSGPLQSTTPMRRPTRVVGLPKMRRSVSSSQVSSNPL